MSAQGNALEFSMRKNDSPEGSALINDSSGRLFQNGLVASSATLKYSLTNQYHNSPTSTTTRGLQKSD